MTEQPFTPTRTVIAQGARGQLVRQVQRALQQGKRYDGLLDGDYGPGTAAAVKAQQKAAGASVTGAVDGRTWKALTGSEVPGLFDRILQVTMRFEGHDFTLAQGNYDGAGITWGVIGFTLMTGDLGPLLKKIHATRPGLMAACFGEAQAKQFLDLLGKPASARLAFANSISLGTSKARLAEPWRKGFRLLGEDPTVQKMQIEAAYNNYYTIALRQAPAFGLHTELGMALLFDIAVQNGGVEDDEAAIIRRRWKVKPPVTQQDRREVIAGVVADTSRPQYREDVRSRKLTMATGAGSVHGETFALANWGLADV